MKVPVKNYSFISQLFDQNEISGATYGVASNEIMTGMRFRDLRRKRSYCIMWLVAFVGAFVWIAALEPPVTAAPYLSPTSTPTASPTTSPSPELALSPAPTPAKSDPAPPVDYFIPDMDPKRLTHNNKYFSIRLGFAILGDYHVMGQDSISRAQVGPQASVFDLRSGRLSITSQLKFKKPWTFYMTSDYDEGRNRGDRVFSVPDATLTIPLWKKSRIAFGILKEPFLYELVGDAANLPQQERLTNAFFVRSNFGIRYNDNFANDRISLSIGVANDWWNNDLKYTESGHQVAGRITGLPIESKDRRTYLHLGLGLRYNGADKDKLRFRMRPESNVTDYYLDTGNFAAKYSKNLSLEFLYNRKAFSVLTEYVQAWVEVPQGKNPSFNGFYVTGSYVLTGENRPYDKAVGYARRIIPKSRWGAVELVGRYGYFDLDDMQYRGGKLDAFYAGVNWWASRQWKVGVGYGFNVLDRFDLSGRTHRFIGRLQWVL